MNLWIAKFMMPIIEAAETVLRTESMRAAKELLDSAITLNATVDEEGLLAPSLKPIIAARTKAIFIQRLEALKEELNAFIRDEAFKAKAKETVDRAKAETGKEFDVRDAYAIIRTLPFYSFSAALKELLILKAASDHDIRSENFKSFHYEYCLKAGASRREAISFVKQYGERALETYLQTCTVKKMRFQYYRTIQRDDLSAEDRTFIENCLLRVAQRATSNKAILNLYDAIGDLQLCEEVPAGIKRRLLDWALAI